MEPARHIKRGALKSICDRCLQLVPAQTVQQGGRIYLRKDCPLHGVSRALLHSDFNYYKRVRRAVSKIEPTSRVAIADCRIDCGICSDHVTKISAVILEMLDMCDMHCPTCVAASSPSAGNVRVAAALASQLNEIKNLTPMPPLLMLSGGEPTIHPEFQEVLNLAGSIGLPHVMVITNGRLIAESKVFVESLKVVKNLEIYLQFDSLDDKALNNIRGTNLRGTRLQAVKNLRDAGIPATLVCVVKRGVNDREMSSIIDFALEFDNIRGVTFQPLRFMGRTDGSSPDCHSITLSEVRTHILTSSDYFRSLDLGPHPLSPETMCIGYFSRKRGGPVSAKVNRYLYGSSNGKSAVARPLFVPPSLQTPDLDYRDLFRVSIVSYLDRFTFTEEAARLCSFAFAVGGNRYIPLDTYYLFYKTKETPLIFIAM